MRTTTIRSPCQVKKKTHTHTLRIRILSHTLYFGITYTPRQPLDRLSNIDFSVLRARLVSSGIYTLQQQQRKLIEADQLIGK